MKQTNYYYFILIFLFSCSEHYSPEIENVLRQAGNNRGELKMVLRHYAKNPADSLKFRAAEFLIVNMPGKYSQYYDAPWNDVATVRLRWTSSPDKQMVLDTYGMGEEVIREDVKCITAEYLIDNIEQSFKAWQEHAWGKHIPFDVFCEEILPYRVSTEPLENWRAKAIASFAGLDSILNKPEMTSVEACETVNSALPRFRIDKDFPSMNFSQLMASARGTCDNVAALSVFSMRALGIPVTFESTPRWVQLPSGHTWNAVRDSTGNHISFMGAETNPGKPHQGNTFLKSKVYRKTFANQANILAEAVNIPPLLRRYNKNAIDVSSTYFGCSDTVTVSLRYPSPLPTGYVYLASENRRQWYPVAWSADSGQTARFTSVGRNIIYQPVYYAAGTMTPAGDPFWLDSAGKMLTLAPDSPDSLLSFTEIELIDELWLSRMAQGQFEGANKNDFSDAQILHTIQDKPDPGYNRVQLKSLASYRYVRYISHADNSACNVAEIMFYGTDGKPLNGACIGTQGAWNNSSRTCDKAFDGDITTFYDAVELIGSWTGLDLHERKKIGEIRYHPRREARHIFEGHEYELFYRTKNGWESLGRQVAATNGCVLQFRAPARALVYLKDITFDQEGISTFFTPERKTGWRVYNVQRAVSEF
jgi:hypothetical protein